MGVASLPASYTHCCITQLAPGHQPCSSGRSSGPQAALDVLGYDLKAAAWVAAHAVGDRSLVQGLKVGWGVGGPL